MTISVAGAFGDSGGTIGTSVADLSVDTSFGAGSNQFISEASGLTALNLNAGGGNVTLTAGGAITDTDGNIDITANVASVTITVAAAFGGSGNAIGTNVADLTVSTSVVAGGSQFISETDGLTALNLNAGAGNVTLTAGGAISDTDGAADITAAAASVTITAAGDFGASGNAIGTSVADLSVDTSFGAGSNQFISEASGLTALNLNAGGGNVTLTAGGAITDTDGNTDITANVASVTITVAAAFGAIGNAIGTNVADLTVSTSVGAGGSQFISETDGLTALNLNAGAGNVTLTAGGAISDTDGAADITAAAASVTITAAGDFGASGNAIGTSVADLSVDTSANAGNQFISEASGLTALNLNAGGGNVTLTAGGAITDTDGNTDITAAVASVTISAAGDFGASGSAIGTNVADLTVNTSANGGDQFISEASGLTALNLNAGAGNVTLTAGGPVSDTDGARRTSRPTRPA